MKTLHNIVKYSIVAMILGLGATCAFAGKNNENSPSKEFRFEELRIAFIQGGVGKLTGLLEAPNSSVMPKDILSLCSRMMKSIREKKITESDMASFLLYIFSQDEYNRFINYDPENSLLEQAIRLKFPCLVDTLIQLGANINERVYENLTDSSIGLLLLAVIEGNAETVQLLLDQENLDFAMYTEALNYVRDENNDDIVTENVREIIEENYRANPLDQGNYELIFENAEEDLGRENQSLLEWFLGLIS